MSKRLFEYNTARLNYSDILKPDPGFKVDFAVGTTYSLDLDAMIAVPLALGLLEDPDDSTAKSPYCILESIRKSSDKFAIFYNAGSMKVPRKPSAYHSLMEKNIFEVNLGKKRNVRGNFHPKLWVIKYTSTAGQSYIKVATLSRNLTFDNSLDVSVVVSGRVSKRKLNNPKPLSDMLNYLVNYARADKAKRKHILSLADDILCLDINVASLGDDFQSVSFKPYGIPGYKTTPDQKDYTMKSIDADNTHALILVSPFLSGKIVEQMSAYANSQAEKHTTLITRRVSVTSSVFSAFNEVYVVKSPMLNESVIEESNDTPDRPLDLDLNSEVKPTAISDIHAKMYYQDHKDGTRTLALGSLNASDNAFYNNVEFMTVLTYASYHGSYNKMHDDLLPKDDKAICPFEKLEACDVSTIESEPDSHVELRDIIDSVKSATITSKDNVYSISINFDLNKLEPSLEKPQIALFHRPGIYLDVSETVVFEDVTLQDLAELFIISRSGETALIKIDIPSLPTEERDRAIYNSIINNRPSLVSYMRFMLQGDIDTDFFDAEDIDVAIGDHTSSDSSSIILPALYEQMLHVAASEDGLSRLNDISDMLDMLDKRDTTDRDVEQLKELLTMCRLARKQVKDL